MKAIVYASVHHGNTKKVVEAIAKKCEAVAKSKNAVEIGRFSCKGYDTFGPFKLIGGLSKGHPDETDLSNAVKFFEGLQ